MGYAGLRSIIIQIGGDLDILKGEQDDLEEILNMTVTGIENDENIENTVVVYVTDKED